jgi:hypothetical protein
LGNNDGEGVTVHIPLNETLDAGEYYLVGSAAGNNAGAWPFFGDGCLHKYLQLPGTIGTTDSSFYGAYDGSENQGFPPASDWIYQAPDSPAEYQVIAGIQ